MKIVFTDPAGKQLLVLSYGNYKEQTLQWLQSMANDLAIQENRNIDEIHVNFTI